MFENIRTGYARLIPSGTNDEEDAEIMMDLGVFEDAESRAEREAALGGGGGSDDGYDSAVDFGAYYNTYCPAWFERFYDNLPGLSLRERLLGCATMMVCGYFLSFGSFVRMKNLMMGDPVPLVVNVTMGNAIALCGTCFLSGPQAQYQRMFHVSRKMASGFYLGSLGFTMVLLLLPHFPLRGLLLFLLMIGQYVAITWYCLSYIPFARDFVSSGCRRLAGAS